MGKIITENPTYAKAVTFICLKFRATDVKFSKVGVPDEIAREVQAASEIFMGTEITDDDLGNIMMLCERVIDLTEYRASLVECLKFCVNAIAPTLTHMVGELVGTRLISHAGSLMNLAKHPSFTA